MKLIAAIIPFAFCMDGVAQQFIESKVYSWTHAGKENQQGYEQRHILEGATTDLEGLKFTGVTLTNLHPELTLTSPEETLILIKEGELKIDMGTSSKTVGPGSVALVLPGIFSTIKASGSTASFYVMRYKGRSIDSNRGKQAGESFILDYNNIPFNQHDKGGVRSYFERPTTMTRRFEMHVTTLNGQIKSHEPHTHKAAEIVLVIQGDTQMQIGDKFYDGQPGDIYFLESNVLHAIRNTGTEPCQYFAFQWE